MIERATIHMKETFFISDDVLKMGFAFFFQLFYSSVSQRKTSHSPC